MDIKIIPAAISAILLLVALVMRITEHKDAAWYLGLGIIWGIIWRDL